MIRLNGVEVPFRKYPNGETLMPEINPQPAPDMFHAEGGRAGVGFHAIELQWESDQDLVNLWLLANHLDGQKTLTVLYMPYSRMDRTDEEGNVCFSLEYIADLINMMGFHVVGIVEPHSDKTLELVTNSVPIWVTGPMVNELVVPAIGFNPFMDTLVFPDEGAAKRYGDMFPEAHNTLVGTKERDFHTGKITGLRIQRTRVEKRLRPKALIVDDLCSRGGTFMDAGQQLKDMGFAQVYLYVTHLEHTVMDGPLLKPGSPINQVFATDTMRWTGGTLLSPELTVYPLTQVNRDDRLEA